jgi:transposase-like protein
MHLTLAQKFQIAELIKTVQTPDGLTYQPGWSDARVAKEFGVNPAQVSTVRKGAFEGMQSRPAGGSSAIQRLTEEISTLNQRLTKLERIISAA